MIQNLVWFRWGPSRVIHHSDDREFRLPFVELLGLWEIGLFSYEFAWRWCRPDLDPRKVSEWLDSKKDFHLYGVMRPHLWGQRKTGEHWREWIDILRDYYESEKTNLRKITLGKEV